MEEERRRQFPVFYSGNPNSDSDHYDPTCQCFNIQVGIVAMDDDTIDGNGRRKQRDPQAGRAPTEPSQPTPTRPGCATHAASGAKGRGREGEDMWRG